MVISWPINQRPNQLLEPDSNRYIKPTTTGEIENGKSISVSNICLPLQSNLAIAQAALTPDTRLIGNEMAAVHSVSYKAATASGSAGACDYTSIPWRSAS